MVNFSDKLKEKMNPSIPNIEKHIEEKKETEPEIPDIPDIDKYTQQEIQNTKEVAQGARKEGLTTLAQLAEEIVTPPGLGEQLFNLDEHIEGKTRLTPELLAQIMLNKQAADVHNMPRLAMMAEDIMKLRVSMMGEGRKEGVDIVKGQNLVGFTSDFAQRTKG